MYIWVRNPQVVKCLSENFARFQNRYERMIRNPVN